MLKKTIGYYSYYFVEQKCVSKYATFLEKEFVLEMSNERKIKLKEVQKS
jgi:hypothetical protein